MKTFSKGNGKIHAEQDRGASVCGRANAADRDASYDQTMTEFLDSAYACQRCTRVLTQRGEVRDAEPGHRSTKEAIRKMAAQGWAEIEGRRVSVDLMGDISVQMGNDGITIQVANAEQAIEVGNAFLATGIKMLQEEARA